VVYTAVGRRLGYPIKLVSVWANDQGSHLLARWVGGGDEEFNIEASGCGLLTPPDAYYRRGQYEMTTEIQELGCYLQSKTPRMELANFLSERAIYQEEFGDWRSCIETTAWAVAMHPENRITENTLKLRMNEWTRQQREQKPVGFPTMVWVTLPRPRLFPETLPIEYERNVHGLRAMDCLLHDPALMPVWEKMRRGEWTGAFPNTVEAVFKPGGGCDIGLHFT
jgi:hypothetical protein